jgi:FkbM family methyltransferase
MPLITDARNVVSFVLTHPANDGARARALLRAARFQARGRVLGRRTLARLGERTLMWADLHRTAASKVVYGNPPDFAEMLVWRGHLRPGDLFLDIGANVGSYALWAAELGADVIALEPAADAFALLTENVALNGYRIEAIRAAAGTHDGAARITTGRDTANRLDPDGGAVVPLLALDSVIGDRAVAGLKIDVEGFEHEVLRGCERALAQQRIKLLQLEWNAASEAAVGADRRPAAALLAAHGYTLCRPGGDGVLRPVSGPGGGTAGVPGFGPDVFARPGRDV